MLSWRSKSARVHAQVKDICAILCGLVVAQDFRRGQKLIVQRDFAGLATFFQDCFEVGRRHKIMNPEKMRDTYGKLMYMLMDASEPEIQELLEFKWVKAGGMGEGLCLGRGGGRRKRSRGVNDMAGAP